jgi:hypothetical protein
MCLILSIFTGLFCISAYISSVSYLLLLLADRRYCFSLFSYGLLLYAYFPFCFLDLVVILSSVLFFICGCLLGLSMSICLFSWWLHYYLYFPFFFYFFFWCLLVPFWYYVFSPFLGWLYFVNVAVLLGLVSAFPCRCLDTNTKKPSKNR